MRLALAVILVALTGCSDAGPDPAPEPTTTPTPTPTPPTPAMIAGCHDYSSAHVVWQYAAAGADESSLLLVLADATGWWALDLQDESDHTHIVATGQGMFGTTRAELDEHLGHLVPAGFDADAPAIAALGWHADVDADAGAALCAAIQDARVEDCAACPFTLTANGSDWTEDVVFDRDTGLGQALCSVWEQTWDDAGVDVTTGHHGDLCPPTTAT